MSKLFSPEPQFRELIQKSYGSMEGPGNGETLKDERKKQDVRHSNIIAAKAVADAVRTSLGPKGMDKMLNLSNGEVIITNDGATILNKMQVLHPAAKMLVELSKSQDIEAGDGTTTVTVIAGSLLDACLKLLVKGIHPTIISESFQKAYDRASSILTSMSQKISLDDYESLIKAAKTSLNSKVVSQYSDLLAPIAVNSVMGVRDPAYPDQVDLRNIKMVKVPGGTIDDTELVEGLVLQRGVATRAGGPTKISQAKIGLIQFQLSPPKTDIENNIVISDYSQMDRILREERSYILNIVKKIKASGCNVLLVQKSILRDAVSDLALHYLAKAKILCVHDIDRQDVDFISKTLKCFPISNVENFTQDKLGYAEVVQEESYGTSRLVRFTGILNMGRTRCIIVRGSNNLMLEEADRSLHDSLCVIRCLIKKGFMIAGGGAPEIQVSLQLSSYSKELIGMESYCVRSYAEALEIIPYTLAENAGLDPIAIVTELKAMHNLNEIFSGVNVRKGCITNILEENVVQPLLVTTSAMGLATECVRMILKIDDIVATL